jgi:hypothetical protein
MSIYSSEITTRLIDPVFDKSNFRSEFRLQDDTVYLASLRLLNVGISSSGTNGLNRLLGSLGCIESMQLFSGNELLDQILSATLLNAFRSANTNNNDNMSLNRYLKYSRLGYLAQGDQSYDSISGGQELDDIKVTVQQDNDNGAGSSAKSWISLKDMLPFLAASNHLPTDRLRNLRLVVNWKQDLRDMVEQDRTATLASLTGTVLVADELNPSPEREAIMKSYSGVRFRPIEHDSVDVPEITGTSGTVITHNQQNTFTVNGFNNKKLSKLAIVKTPLDNSTWTSGTANVGFANQGSIACWDERTQVRVNGANKLPAGGITSPNQRLAMITDAYGTINLVQGQQCTWLAEGQNQIEDYKTMGQLSYTGLVIDEPSVRELVVEFDRRGVYQNDSTTQGLRLNLFGETEKAVVPTNDGKINVIYTTD